MKKLLLATAVIVGPCRPAPRRLSSPISVSIRHRRLVISQAALSASMALAQEVLLMTSCSNSSEVRSSSPSPAPPTCFPVAFCTTDFITNFSASVFGYGPDNLFGGGDDNLVLGPANATMGCGLIVNCQGMAGIALLDAGNYYLEISGTGGGTSGYGGNIATLPKLRCPQPCGCSVAHSVAARCCCAVAKSSRCHWLLKLIIRRGVWHPRRFISQGNLHEHRPAP